MMAPIQYWMLDIRFSVFDTRYLNLFLSGHTYLVKTESDMDQKHYYDRDPVVTLRGNRG